jgi:phosphoribosylanthranilate isomerase
MATRVKICGVTTVEDAELCAEAGADAVGLNFWSGSKRHVPVEVAARIARALPSAVLKVGVFVDASREDIARTVAAVGLDCVQLHGDEPPEDCLGHRGVRVIKALRVGPDAAATHAEALRFAVDWILLDADAGQGFGGSGRRFDWLRAVGVAPGRLFLAGGLTPDNVAEAIRIVAPAFVDVASGVEREPGRKDPVRVREFIAHAKHA